MNNIRLVLIKFQGQEEPEWNDSETDKVVKRKVASWDEVGQILKCYRVTHFYSDAGDTLFRNKTSLPFRRNTFWQDLIENNKDANRIELGLSDDQIIGSIKQEYQKLKKIFDHKNLHKLNPNRIYDYSLEELIEIFNQKLAGTNTNVEKIQKKERVKELPQMKKLLKYQKQNRERISKTKIGKFLKNYDYDMNFDDNLQKSEDKVALESFLR